MPQDIQDDASYNKVEEESRRSIHLMDCMRLFTEKETLGKDDAWLAHTHKCCQYSRLVNCVFTRYCPECKDFVQASKKFDLWKLPDILVIHLKRFSYDRYTHLTQHGYKQSIHLHLSYYLQLLA